MNGPSKRALIVLSAVEQKIASPPVKAGFNQHRKPLPSIENAVEIAATGASVSVNEIPVSVFEEAPPSVAVVDDLRSVTEVAELSVAVDLAVSTEEVAEVLAEDDSEDELEEI